MELATLFSGSSGNCIYVGTAENKLLIDAGNSGKKIAQALQDIDVEIGDIKAILVTHEHIDHIKGLGILSRRYDIPIYASPKTWDELTGLGEIKEENKKEFSYGMEFGDIKVEFFKTCHDAVQPVGMAFYQGKNHVGVATDTGCVTAGMRKYLTGADALVFEANHDEKMLMEGPYPYHLKKRVSGDQGHLSNRTCGKALGEMITGDTRQVILAHLSEVNNTPEIAYRSVKESLVEAGIDETMKLSVAPRYQSHQVIKIRRM